MRLKKLILHGFKSFADRTEFAFDAPITGIVGPNGCGKSNVVDAMKWVLGEQSAKSLRGDAMMDVIFNGAAERKPAGMAEVTLVFENPLRHDGSRPLNMATDEVAVGRRLFRDGTSEYQINNTTTRLKDVRELFLDTGVGVDAYSVIEQGRVSALLEANPQERRVIFEEAAGISKFKQRKKETQRKLERVDQNLLRVNDIVEEVDKRLRSVKMQAGKARTYRELSARLGELRLSHSLQEYHTQHIAQQELNQGQEESRFRLDDATGDLSTAQNALALKKENLEALRQTRQRLEYALVQARAQIQAAKQRQQYASQQLEQMAEQLAAFEQENSRVEEKLSEVKQSLEAERNALSEYTEQLQQQVSEIERHQKAFDDGQMELSNSASIIERKKESLLDLMRKLAEASSRLGAIEIERKNVLSQQTRLSDRTAQVDSELHTLDATGVDLGGKLAEAEHRMIAEQAELEERRGQAAALDQHISDLGESLGAAKEHRSGLISRQKLLSDLEAKREGVSEGGKAVLRQRDTKFPFVRGLVADILRVDVEHAAIIDAALAGREQLLVTSDTPAIVSAQDVLEELEGRVNLLCTDRIEEFLDVYDWNQHGYLVRLAIDLVRFQPEDAVIARHLLGRTVIVEDLAIALHLQECGPRGYRYVTKSGQVVERDGVVRVGPLTAAMGLLSRRSELEALTQQIADVDERIGRLSAELAAGTSQAQALEEDISGLRNAIYQTNTSRIELNSAIAQNVDRQGSLTREKSVLERESGTLAEQMVRLEEEESALSRRKSDLETEQSAITEIVEQLTHKQKTITEELRQLGHQLTSCRVHLGQIQEKQLGSGQAVERQMAATRELGEQIERVNRSAAAVAERREDVRKERESAIHAEAALSQGIVSDEQRVGELAGQVEQAGAAVTELSRSVESLREKRELVEQELHDLQVRIGEVRVRLEGLVQRTSEELQLDLPGRYTELTADGKVYEPAQVDWDAIGAEIKELREKIQRLGNVNLEAIDEHDELEKRRQFMDTQVADLTTAKAQLETLIREINAESGIRFETTFNAVREHFQGMFRKLFGGGKADIYLETELDQPANAAPMLDESGQPVEAEKIKVDILDAGIEIIARPPGKQPVSISQLSGGEKTMTCVALLMSIFKSKPSPFCVLDEVDAALDEANNQRFNMIIQEFLEQSQFIIVTHSKRTMQIADILYGVTMPEQGVSRRVSVRFDQVEADGKIAEHAAA